MSGGTVGIESCAACQIQVERGCIGFDRQHVDGAKLNMLTVPIGLAARQPSSLANAPALQSEWTVANEVFRFGPFRVTVSFDAPRIDGVQGIECRQIEKIGRRIFERHLIRAIVEPRGSRLRRNRGALACSRPARRRLEMSAAYRRSRRHIFAAAILFRPLPDRLERAESR